MHIFLKKRKAYAYIQKIIYKHVIMHFSKKKKHGTMNFSKKKHGTMHFFFL